MNVNSEVKQLNKALERILKLRLEELVIQTFRPSHKPLSFLFDRMARFGMHDSSIGILS